MRERSPRRVAADGKLQITTQFRVRGGMAYELREQGERLTVLLTTLGSEGPSSEWTCESFGAGAEEPRVSHAAATRAAALGLTRATWEAQDRVRGIRRFDWGAVERVLAGVRAI